MILITISQAQAQKSMLSMEAGLSCNLVPVWESDNYNPDWKAVGWNGNLSPYVHIRFGNKIAGVFQASYTNHFFNYSVMQHASGGTGHKYIDSKLSEINLDFLFEFSPGGRSGFYLRAGPSVGLPVNLYRETITTFEGPWYSYDYAEENTAAEYKVNLQAEFAVGCEIPLTKKDLINVGVALRGGILKVPILPETSTEARTLCIQFTLGYRRVFGRE